MSLTALLNRLKTSPVDAQLRRQLIAAFEFEQPRRLRPQGVVLDQRARAEVAPPQAAERPVEVVHARAGRDDRAHRFRHVLARRIELGEPRLRPRHIAVERQPALRAVVVGELHAVALARRARLGRRTFAVVGQLRVEPQRPERSVVCRCGTATVRTPTSAPLAARAASPASTGLPVRSRAASRAARVVAVEPLAGVHVELGAAPRAERHAALRADDAGASSCRC